MKQGWRLCITIFPHGCKRFVLLVPTKVLCKYYMIFLLCENVSSYMCCCIRFLAYVLFFDYTVVLYVINRMKYLVHSLSCGSFSYCKYVNFFIWYHLEWAMYFCVGMLEKYYCKSEKLQWWILLDMKPSCQVLYTVLYLISDGYMFWALHGKETI